LKESVNTLAASFGEMFLPAAIDVVNVLTSIANVINDSPLLKGLLTAAIVTITGYLAAMAVQATVAFARQMALNLALGAVNPVVMGATIAVAALAAGYVIYASKVQAAKREAEDFALATLGSASALDAAAGAARRYVVEFKNMSGGEINMSIADTRMQESALRQQLQARQNRLLELQKPLQTIGDTDYDLNMQINREAEIRALEGAIAETEQHLGKTRADLEAQQQAYRAWQEDNKSIAVDPIPSGENAANAANAWIKQWKEQWERFQAEQSPDPFANVELDRGKKLGEARTNNADKETIDQINEYYNAKRTEIADKLMEEEKRRMLSLSKTKVDDLEYEMEKELEAINKLEEQRVFAAAGSEEEIAAIRRLYSEMRVETTEQYEADIAKTEFEEAKAAIVDWQQTLNDSLAQGLLDMGVFSSEAAIILGDLSAQFLELTASSALGGFEEFGRALGEGEDAANSLKRALGAMAQQILKQLPMMFLQAGLQLIANGQWALGLGFIAASASTAIMSGYVEGVQNNAKGGVYDEYGKAAAFAAGGVFTNRVVDGPAFFRFASGAGFATGVMGEAGPEAIMPLRRGPDGSLGVSATGGACTGGTAVYVIIQNFTNEEVREEESTDGGGNQIRKIIIGAVKESFSNGEMDRPMASRYGIRAQGV
ncbi:MAG: hypothetical protein LBB82_09510, partial [Treponema sp.]|nr:hypothetical protein [Treponema sp.]